MRCEESWPCYGLLLIFVADQFYSQIIADSLDVWLIFTEQFCLANHYRFIARLPDVRGSVLLAIDCRFMGCLAVLCGSILLARRCRFVGCLADRSGSILLANHCRFVGCLADRSGSSLLANHCRLVRCLADRSGSILPRESVMGASFPLAPRLADLLQAIS